MSSRTSFGITLVCLIAAIVLLVMSIVTSWYSWKNEGIITTTDSNETMVNYTVNAKVDLFLIGQKYEVTIKDENGTEISHETTTQNWNTAGSDFSHIRQMYIDILGMICGSIFLFIICSLFVFAKFSEFQQVKKIAKVFCCGRHGRYVLVAFAWIASVLTIVCCLMLLRQPNSFDSDFDSYEFGIPCGDGCSAFSGSESDLKWGPGVGWYLCWLSFALSIIIGIQVSVNRKRFQYHRIQ